MTTHRYRTEIELPLGIEEVFVFFADPRNLERITPPELSFEILTPEPLEIREGTLIDYRLRLFGVAFRWRARISAWAPPDRFVDEQMEGPYKLWIHEHLFAARNGSTVIQDEVQYRLPFWPVGELAYPGVRAEVERIFRFRRDAIRRALLGDQAATAGAVPQAWGFWPGDEGGYRS
jgi:ligand-binding SRPBCC domain-containing protein